VTDTACVSSVVGFRPISALPNKDCTMEPKAWRNRLRNVPRFYFHLVNDLDVPDLDGLELADMAAARQCALRSARFTAAETIKETGRLDPLHRIDIEDEHGNVLETVHFRDAVKIEGPRPNPV